MKLKELANLITAPEIIYVYSTEGHALAKATAKNINNYGFIKDKEVVSISASNLGFTVTVKE